MKRHVSFESNVERSIDGEIYYQNENLFLFEFFKNQI